MIFSLPDASHDVVIDSVPSQSQKVKVHLNRFRSNVQKTKRDEFCYSHLENEFQFFQGRPKRTREQLRQQLVIFGFKRVRYSFFGQIWEENIDHPLFFFDKL